MERHPSQQAMRNLESNLPEKSVGSLILDACRKFETRTAIELFENGCRLTYGQLRDRVSSFASTLLEADLEPGTKVAVMTADRISYPVAWLGNAVTGMCTVPINFQYTARELHYTLTDSASTVLVIDSDLLEQMAETVCSIPSIKLVVVIGESDFEGKTTLSFKDISRAEAGGTNEWPECSLQTMMNIQYTSGTTGLPKGAILSHRYWSIMSHVGLAQVDWRMENTLIWQPFYYVDAQWQFLSTLFCGGTAHVCAKMSSSRFVKWIKKQRISFCIFPEIAARVVEETDDGESALEHLYCYSHRPENYRAYEKRFNCRARQGFAMTEVGVGTYVPREADDMTGTCTVGLPAAFKEVGIFDSNGKEVGADVIGEICIRGDGMFSGYVNRPDAMEASFFPGGWFRTGDQGQKDRDGWIFFLGRSKDMVRRSGENISAIEVEAVLRAYPGLLEAAVIPVPDDIRGEEIKAYVRLAAPREEALGAVYAIIKHCEENLAPFKIPRYFDFADEFPQTASGKIRKSLLTQDVPDLRIGSFDRVTGAWFQET
jgi:long-chain acyl-CoA synthetase